MAEPTTYFQTLGNRVDQRWRAVNYRESEFPRIAFEALRDEPMSAHLDPLDPIRWLMRQAVNLPFQLDLEGAFGQPPLVTFATTRFLIHVLYWLDSTTRIHQHGFCGAFQVAGGSSLHSQFTYETEERVSSRFLLGRLEHRGSELLQVGATRPILPDHHFIHSLFHLDHPSVSVVVRTFEDPGAEPQYNYERSGIATDPFFKDPLTVRHVQSVAMLGQLKHPDFQTMVLELLDRSDLCAVHAVLKAVLAKERDPNKLGPYLERLRARLGSRVDLLDESMREWAREHNLLAMRKEVTDPHLRFFLALLLNLRRREQILEVIQARFPGQPPHDLILRWLSQLSQDPAANREGLGFALDEPMLLVIRCELEGLTHAQLLDRFAEEYDSAEVAAQAPDLAEFVQAFRASPMLGPLFQGGSTPCRPPK